MFRNHFRLKEFINFQSSRTNILHGLGLTNNEINLFTKFKMFVLHELVRTRNSLERLVELLENGADANLRNDDADTPLHVVASKNEVNPQDLEENVQLAKVLIRFTADVNLQNNAGKTPLILAVQARNCRMTEYLMEIEANTDVRDNDGNTALHHATLQSGFSFQNEGDFIRDPVLKLVRVLLRSDIDLDVKNSSDQTPLMLAVKNQDLGVVKQLLNKHPTLDLVDVYGNTALHYAFDQDHVDLDIVLELMRRGCQFNIRNLNDLEPISVYINKLFDAPADELENAKSVFKHCLLRHGFYGVEEKQAMETISREKNCQLFQFLEHCGNEIEKMIHDQLPYRYTVHTIALRGLHGIKDNISRIPSETFESVLNKLMKPEYPVYRDVIVSGISSKFMNDKFAETGCFLGNTGSDRFDYIIFSKIPLYLPSHMDMLNFMIACSPDKRNRGPFSLFRTCFRSCSEP